MLPAILAGAGLLGKLFSGAAKGAADGRATEAGLNLGRDNIASRNFDTRQGAEMQSGQLDLQRQQFGANNRGQLAKQALIGQLLGGGLQPTAINVPGIKSANVSGGLLQSLLQNPEAMAAMRTMGQQAGQAQQTPLSFQGGNLLQAPRISQTPQSSGWEKLAGILGTAGSLAGGVGQVMSGLGGEASASAHPAVQDNLARIVRGNPNIFGDQRVGS